MNELMLTLYRIQKESGFAPREMIQAKGTEKLSEFDKLRKRIGLTVKHIRNTLKERDELLSTLPNTKTTASLSAQVRSQIKACKKDAAELAKMQQKEADEAKAKAGKKGSLSEAAQAKLELGEEIVQLVYKHIEECENMERRRRVGVGLGTGPDDDDDNPDGVDGVDGGRRVVSSLPDIDDDGPLGQKFALLRQQDKTIDKQLDRVHEGVLVLKDMAEEISKEADLHSAMLVELDDQTMENMAKVEHLNKRLKGILENVRSGNRFILDFICVVVLLVVIGVIVRMVLKMTG